LRIVITGATGLLGRNLVFEILKANIKNLDNIQILILGRSHKTVSLYERIIKILSEDGYEYIGINPKDSKDIIKKIHECIVPISFDLAKEGLDLSQESMNLLKSKKIDYFFHLASMSDFRLGNQTRKKLENINIEGTNRILQLISEIDVNEAIYTGSAYSFGGTLKVIYPDDIITKGDFRNFYEESKLLAEINFRKSLKVKKVKYRIFRPVGICGRLIEPPIGSINKFHDLFYGWAMFFLKEKLNITNDFAAVYDDKVELNIRVTCNQKTGLNIVPADYAAKFIYSVCINNAPGESYHIANKSTIAHTKYLSLILNELNISGVTFIDVAPVEQNRLEKIYYRSVGQIYTPYLLMGDISFANRNIIDIEKANNLSCPEIDTGNFLRLIRYAKERHFGLIKKRSGQ
jgi:nucleoside-diphosphate-sugar epimerase